MGGSGGVIWELGKAKRVYCTVFGNDLGVVENGQVDALGCDGGIAEGGADFVVVFCLMCLVLREKGDGRRNCRS